VKLAEPLLGWVVTDTFPLASEASEMVHSRWPVPVQVTDPLPVPADRFTVTLLLAALDCVPAAIRVRLLNAALNVLAVLVEMTRLRASSRAPLFSEMYVNRRREQQEEDRNDDGELEHGLRSQVVPLLHSITMTASPCTLIW
jgi:hypothetical protein